MISPSVYHRIPKISPGARIFQKPFMRVLDKEGNLRYKMTWTCSSLQGNLCVITLSSFFFILYLRVISKYKPLWDYIRRGDLTEWFLCYEFWGLIHGGAFFRNFTVTGFLEVTFSVFAGKYRRNLEFSYDLPMS